MVSHTQMDASIEGYIGFAFSSPASRAGGDTRDMGRSIVVVQHFMATWMDTDTANSVLFGYIYTGRPDGWQRVCCVLSSNEYFCAGGVVSRDTRGCCGERSVRHG